MTQETLSADPVEQEATAASPDTVTPLYFRIRSPADFARLRQFFAKIGYTEAGICARGKCASVPELSVPEGDAVVADALDVCLNLFIHGFEVPRSVILQHISESDLQFLRDFGLVMDSEENPDLCYAPLALYPLHGLYFTSDQARTFTKPASEVVVDVVYSALPTTTTEFIQSLPTTPCDAFLDIGSGTGVAALTAAKNYARHAWAVDITERSTRVAEFNAKLNGIENVTALKGDIYAPVLDLTFDRIVAHPPYMPNLNPRLIFRDGGEDGEQITRRIIQGLPDRLRPGGRFHCRTLSTDRANEPFEQRMRKMLGARSDEFDVAVVTNMSIPPARFYFRMISNGGMTAIALDMQVAVFERLAVESVSISFVTIERHAEKKEPITARRHIESGEVPAPVAVDWLLRFERARTKPDFTNGLRTVKPTVSPHAEIKIAHQMREAKLRAHAASVSTNYPFGFTMESSPGLVLIVASCDGTRTVEELHKQMMDVGAIPPTTPIEEFLQFTTHLIAGGILEIEQFALPAAPPVTTTGTSRVVG
jgi:methylase of polypeptide subunit release factors